MRALWLATAGLALAACVAKQPAPPAHVPIVGVCSVLPETGPGFGVAPGVSVRLDGGVVWIVNESIP